MTSTADEVLQFTGVLDATKCAQAIGESASDLQQTVSKVTESADQALKQLAGCDKDKEIREIADELGHSLLIIKKAGDGLVSGCTTLRDDLIKFKGAIEDDIKAGKCDMDRIIRRLEKMLQSAETCSGDFSVFMEKLDATNRLCNRVHKECERLSDEKKNSASTGRIVGYTATVALSLGTIVAGFLTVATGGLAAPVCAAAGFAAATGAGVCTGEVTGKLDSLGQQFKECTEKLSDSLKGLTAISENVKGMQRMTGEMTKNLEKALKMLIIHMNESEKKDIKIAEQNEMILDKDKEIMDKDKEIMDKDKEIMDKDKEIMELRAKLGALPPK